jgi:S1-C subfamily serine protease
MLIKVLLGAFVVLIFLGLGAVRDNTLVYEAPEIEIQNEIVATTTLNSEKVDEEISDKIAVEKEKPKTTTTQTVSKTPKPAENNSTQVKIPGANVPQTQVNVVLPQLPPPDFETINNNGRKVIVNILCTTDGNELSPISGTGVIVGQSGLILTNAHIGQYLLLKDFRRPDSISCVARTGSPAYPKYKLDLVYISPTWVNANKRLLKEEDPKGTGENDYAFLRISSNVDNSPLPQGFYYIPMNISEDIARLQPVLLISYPAGFLGGLSILQDLNITSSVTLVSDLFTYSQNTIDLISVPGTVLSQKGSSGGAVIDRFTTLIGIITTSTEGETTDKRDLRAITLSYINRSLQSEFGISLEQFIQADPAEFAKKFQEISAPILTKIITDELIH